MVMERGREFESRQRILDVSYFTYICCKIELSFEQTKVNEKEAEEILMDGDLCTPSL